MCRKEQKLNNRRLEKLQNHTLKPIRRGHQGTQMNRTPESEECFPGEKGPSTSLIPGTTSAGEEIHP